MRQLTPTEQREILDKLKNFLKTISVVDKEKVVVESIFLATGDGGTTIPPYLKDKVEQMANIIKEIPFTEKKNKQFCDMMLVLIKEIKEEKLLEQ
ncbi:MAG: hypothetical protein U9P90_01255 [Patescibacteria group bacterium]|nr:hypothetical protein [Patescibacteria group bacterium]